ncbi:hypothetical protein D3C87_2114870 [compost metagenome]
MYYLRTQAANAAVKFTVEKQAEKQLEPMVQHTGVEEEITGPVCTMEEGCVTCSA